jgi:hypothetical protein
LKPIDERVDEYIYQEGVMKVENGEKSMKTTILWKSALVVSALLVFLFAILGEAAPMGEAVPQVATAPLKATTPPLKVTFRPLSEFLDAQGTTSPLFFPPVPNYVGWSDDPEETTFALIDYAGLANDYLDSLGVKLGTRVDGFVIQSEFADGRTQIAVALFTTKALGFAQLLADIDKVGFLNAPTIFGNKAQDVANGAKAAVGQSTFFVTFSISGPEAPLPDLNNVVDVVKHPEFSPVDINFTATIPGKCEHGKHGTRAVLHVDQAGPPGCKPSPSPGCRGIVKIVREPCN